MQPQRNPDGFRPTGHSRGGVSPHSLQCLNTVWDLVRLWLLQCRRLGLERGKAHFVNPLMLQSYSLIPSWE
jgi:hypothetical protein